MTMSDRIAVMNKGRYEQLGDPESLYERPATRFVAGFLGVSNLLPATRDGADDKYAVVRLPDGSAARAPRAAVDATKGPIAIGIRPEKIRLLERTDPVKGNPNRLEGVVTDASYIGVSTQYVVELPDERRVTVFEQNVERASKAELWQPGEQVLMTWLPEHSFIVADEGGVTGEPGDELSEAES